MTSRTVAAGTTSTTVDEQRADGVERDDRGGAEARQQQPVGEHGAQAERARAAGLEAGGEPVPAQRRVEHDRDRRDRAR